MTSSSSTSYGWFTRLKNFISRFRRYWSEDERKLVEREAFMLKAVGRGRCAYCVSQEITSEHDAYRVCDNCQYIEPGYIHHRCMTEICDDRACSNRPPEKVQTGRPNNPEAYDRKLRGLNG